MNKIEKPQHFFRKNVPYFLGGIYFLTGAVLLFDEKSLSSVPYMLVGIAGIVVGFAQRNSRAEYIKWDDNEIVVKDLMNGKLTYSWHKVDDLIFSNNHLTIKSGAANGVMVELKEYAETDIEFMKSSLSTNFSMMNQNL